MTDGMTDNTAINGANGIIITQFTEAQQKALVECETTLDNNEAAVFDYVFALKRIDHEKLYLLKGDKDFASYLGRRIETATKKHTSARVGQLVRHTIVMLALSEHPAVKTLPANERQTRELKGDPEEMVAEWLGAQVASGDDQPSYSWVRSSAETLEQAKENDNLVDVGHEDGEGVPLEVGYKKATALNEYERLLRQIDHIKANRQTKPLAKFVAAPQAIFNGNWLSFQVPEGGLNQLRVGQQVRVVIYPVMPTGNAKQTGKSK